MSMQIKIAILQIFAYGVRSTANGSGATGMKEQISKETKTAKGRSVVTLSQDTDRSLLGQLLFPLFPSDTGPKVISLQSVAGKYERGC